MRRDYNNSISNSERLDLIELSKDLCVDSDELTEFILKAVSYNQAWVKILNIFEDIYMSDNNCSGKIRVCSSGVRFSA